MHLSFWDQAVTWRVVLPNCRYVSENICPRACERLWFLPLPCDSPSLAQDLGQDLGQTSKLKFRDLGVIIDEKKMRLNSPVLEMPHGRSPYKMVMRVCLAMRDSGGFSNSCWAAVPCWTSSLPENGQVYYIC